MQASATSKYKSRDYLAGPLITSVLLLEAVHVLILWIAPHPRLFSNILQLVFPILIAAISLHQRLSTSTLVGRRCWSALAVAFGFWAIGQGVFLYSLYSQPETDLLSRIDEALWLIFGLPLLLAVNTGHDEVDKVGWFDRAQAILFFGVLYLLVFLPSVQMNFITAEVIQDLALILCCVLRLPVCTLARERRFFTRLALFLLLYGPMTILGDSMQLRGWHYGSAVDLVWTLPMALLAVLILHDARRSEDTAASTTRFVQVIQEMQGLGVAALAFVTVGLSALLALYQPVLGGLCLIASFGLFALRTNARERTWYQTHGRLEETVLQDSLTGLGNRSMLRAALQGQLAGARIGGTPALIFADLDRFRKINDDLGHALADRLLVKVAERLRAAIPAEAVLCRHDADEFVVLLPATDSAKAASLAETLLTALRPAYPVDGQVIRCTATLGVILAAPGEHADDLLRTADHAMYRAKQLGTDSVCIFDASLRAQMNSRWQMESDLRTTLDRGEIGIAFQPILSVEGGEISGFEALARWSHPRHGAVPPAEFIPLAEESGLILPLGAQVLEKACQQVAHWNQAWSKDLSLSVNVSPHQFQDPGLVPRLLEMLVRTGLPPRLLRLEITESALLIHEDLVKKSLIQARSQGIRISLDDFGTGYSSLAFLLRLPVDEVKVDRSFVSDMQSDPKRKELVRTVVHLGQSMGKRVVAEGVETEQDLRDLAAMGCESAQGWLISRPLPAEVLEAHMPSIAARSAQAAQALQSIFAAEATNGRPEPWNAPLAQAGV